VVASPQHRPSWSECRNHRRNQPRLFVGTTFCEDRKGTSEDALGGRGHGRANRGWRSWGQRPNEVCRKRWHGIASPSIDELDPTDHNSGPVTDSLPCVHTRHRMFDAILALRSRHNPVNSARGEVGVCHDVLATAPAPQPYLREVQVCVPPALAARGSRRGRRGSRAPGS
jgi:hypothetical protein